jgi:predicted MFS family arabinose efflux permease
MGQSVVALLLVLAMASSVIATATYSVVAPVLLDDLGIGRSTYGILVAVSSGVGAVASPLMGRLADRLSPAFGLRLVFAIAVLSAIWVASARSLTVLFAATILAGLANAMGNPATNRLIARTKYLHIRGWLVGVKQSGTQVAFFLAGAMLPAVAIQWGWRTAFVAVAAVPAIGLAVSATKELLDDSPELSPDSLQGRDCYIGPRRVLPAVRLVAAYGAFMGLASGAVMTFLPLYTHEVLRAPVTTGGLLVAAMGLTGMAARILWAQLVERTRQYGRLLLLLGIVAAGSTVLIGAGIWLGIGTVWIGAILAGGSLIAWNAVGMLAVMHMTPERGIGRASGVVGLGFLGGLTLSPILAGQVLDLTDSYFIVWIGATACTVVSGILAWYLVGKID